jgi:hypothetical protein
LLRSGRLLEVSVVKLSEVVVFVALFKIIEVIPEVVAIFLFFFTVSSKARAGRRFLYSRRRLPS